MLKINNLIVILLLTILISVVNAYSLTDSNPSNNVKTITVNVVETKKLNLTFIPIDNPNDFDSNVEEFVKFFNLTYPVPDDRLLVSKGQPYTSSQEERNFPSLLLFKIAKLSLLENIKRTIGVLPQNWFLNFANDPKSYGKAFTSLGTVVLPSALAEARGMRQIVAHEIGHTFGLCDEHNATYWDKQDIPLFRCPNGDVDDNNILDTNCEGKGCPTLTLGKLVPWNNSNEFINMTNLMGTNDQDKTWISNESYLHLLSEFQKSPIIVQTALIVNGIINKTSGTIKLFTSYIIENAEITQQDENTIGNYSIEIIDNDGVITSQINFTPSFLDVGFNGSTVETNISFFIVTMNFSSTDKGVKIRENNIVKDETNRTTNTPSLNLIFPIGGETISQQTTISYDATDADSDTINYAILISSDNGATFSTLAIDYPNKTFFLNITPFPDGNQYKIKILATDGINTDTAISNAFTINNSIEVTPGNFEFKKVKTKCGEDKEKDYIHISGSMEGFEPETDFNIEIKGNPAIFGPVSVTVPFGTKTVAIPKGKVQSSFPNDGIGNFHVNVDADNLNDCPDNILEADLSLNINGVRKTATLEREKNSKFFSTPTPNNLISGLAFLWLSFIDMITSFK